MLDRLSLRALRFLAVAFFLSTVVMGSLLFVGWRYLSRVTAKTEPPGEAQPVRKEPTPVSPLLLSYQLDLPGRGEIFPALAGSSAAEYWPVAVLTVVNMSEQPTLLKVSAEVRDWSRPSEKTLIVGPRETRQLRLNPELLPRVYRNHEVRRASLDVKVTSLEGETFFADTREVLLHSGSELYWGKKFANAQLVARWITPHDPAVLRLVSQARQFLPRGRLGGYNISARASDADLKRQVRHQAEAVFRAMQRTGISYVSSIFVYGDFIEEAQRIRLPRETLELRNANCIDVSVLFASAMENLGLEPVVVIVPGHAFTGVRLTPKSGDILYLDLTVLPKGSFSAAIRRASDWRKKADVDKEITVDVATTRKLGIYPIPFAAPAPSAAGGGTASPETGE